MTEAQNCAGCTRKLTHADFCGSAQLVDLSVIIDRAHSLGVEPEVLQAFTRVESPKGPFLPDRRPRILYEAHVFSRNTDHKFDSTHPTLSSRKWDRSLYGADGIHQYDRLYAAMQLDQRAALMACSWGSWQVLGENYKKLGYSCVEELVLQNVESQGGQFECFIKEITTTPGLLHALQIKDWERIAYLYNGPSFRSNAYDTKMATEYRQLVSHTLTRGSSGIAVVSLQKMLVAHSSDPKPDIDGVFGPTTEAAVKNLQRRWGLKEDGIVGPATYRKLAEMRIDQGPLIKSKRIAGATVLGGAGVATINVATEIANITSNIDLTDTTQSIISTTEQITQGVQASKQVVVSIKDAAALFTNLNSKVVIFLYVISAIMLLSAAYFVWTKLHDRKRLGGFVNANFGNSESNTSSY